MTAPSAWDVDVAWSRLLGGVFVIGTSTIGGTDVIAGDFGSSVFDSIAGDLQALSYHRGRSSDMAYMEQGGCTAALTDENGKYNSENPASPLAGYIDVMRPLRVRANYGGVAYGRFYGFTAQVRNISREYKSEIAAVDFFEWLHWTKPVIAEQPYTSVEALISLILDYAGWTDPTMRSLEQGGDVIPSWSADGSKSGLQLIQEMLATDLGMFFIAGSGVATYRTRNTRYANGTPVATLGGTIISELDAEINKDGIVNKLRATRTGGTEQTAEDATSIARYAEREGSAVTSANFASDSQALSFAQFIVATNKDPRPRPKRVVVHNGDEARLLQQLQREIGDLVTVADPLAGISFHARIQALSEDVSSAGKIIQTTYTVEKVTACAFTIGTSTIGGSDVISY